MGCGAAARAYLERKVLVDTKLAERHDAPAQRLVGGRQHALKLVRGQLVLPHAAVAARAVAAHAVGGAAAAHRAVAVQRGELQVGRTADAVAQVADGDRAKPVHTPRGARASDECAA